MEKQKLISCHQANEKDFVEFLAAIGYAPAKIRRTDYWYLSPLRLEKTASFKVNRTINRWYDHGIGKGGNLVDFGIIYYKCTVKEFLQKLDHHNLPCQHPPDIEREASPIIKITRTENITSSALLNYLTSRRINPVLAGVYCREIGYSIGVKEYYAIGFRNNSGGYELRNTWFKGSSSPKDCTTFRNNSKTISVFEGFFDFLSYQSIMLKHQVDPTDFLILNSLSFFERSKSFMDEYRSRHLFLDRDKAGRYYTGVALSWDKNYVDESALYAGYKDLNDWIQHIGKSRPHV